jgi:hypothetical protein
MYPKPPTRSASGDHGTPRFEKYAHRSMSKCRLNHRNVTCRAPSLSNERLSPNVIIEQVERLVYSLFLAHEIFPAEQRLANPDEFCAARAPSVVQGQFEVFYAHCHVAQRLETLVWVCVNGIDRGTKGFGDLANFCEQGFAVSKDDKNILVGSIAGRGIDEGIGNVNVIHIKVTTKDAPEDALERGQTGAINHTSDESAIYERDQESKGGMRAEERGLTRGRAER